MVLGLGEGWNDEYNNLKKQIENGMTFAPTNVNLPTVGMHERGAGFNYGGGNFTFNIYSPKALDSVTAAREAKKAAQKMAMGFI